MRSTLLTRGLEWHVSSKTGMGELEGIHGSVLPALVLEWRGFQIIVPSVIIPTFDPLLRHCLS